ncbi:hypothetical protein K461DRAFT_244951 [Myriangium duriaei CBS 260.36]|uniref:gamma-glutamylcyclotransferase n=1 Tax=Myriangium duriaei CBS 260.36 TaxID=1168546 RepID=A0A9P4IWF6_9PEZI|nr:hypothetical protein K461DRAFT_244951 [Myriangium duriaei CBS 260.36]
MGVEDTNRALAAEGQIYTQARARASSILGAPEPHHENPTTTSTRRRTDSISEPANAELSGSETVLYLAYGSNLCDETFLGRRNIKPISAINVLVPDLRLTFDLPGVPYNEPCFANSARRSPPADKESSIVKETTPLLSSNPPDDRYHKNRWHKGLVGVVYEVTKADYAIIIATEGGGASYHDILIDCYPLDADEQKIVPAIPEGQSFKAHTLFAPADVDESEKCFTTRQQKRPDPDYAQASARYLKLITDGARQRKLPLEYRQYLEQIRPYTVTTWGQSLGRVAFTTIWIPLIMIYFTLGKMFADKKGRSPRWVQAIGTLLFRFMWLSYDHFFKPLFGDGERTIYKDE